MCLSCFVLDPDRNVTQTEDVSIFMDTTDLLNRNVISVTEFDYGDIISAVVDVDGNLVAEPQTGYETNPNYSQCMSISDQSLLTAIPQMNYDDCQKILNDNGVDSDNDEDYIPPTDVSDNNSDSIEKVAYPVRAKSLCSAVPENNENQITANKNGEHEIMLRSGIESNSSKPLVRKRLRNESTWARNIKKEKINSGQAYVSRLGKERNAKECGPPCTEKCLLSCARRFSVHGRKKLFDKLYSLENITRKRDYLSRLISSKVDDCRSQTSRKPNYEFFFEVGNSKERVCKQMFKSTFCLSNNFISTVLKKKDESGFIEKDMRGKHGNQKQINEILLQSVVDHINTFPRVESHYCRSRTKKEYLEGALNISTMYRLYVEHCRQNDSAFVKQHKYETIFNTQFNIGFHKPKKDRCLQCAVYDDSSPEEQKEKEETIRCHREEVALSRQEKEIDKQKVASCKETTLAIYDLQAVIQLPQGKQSIFFYKSKLNLFNLTVLEISNKNQGHSFMWHEGIAKRGAVEIVSCIYEFIKENCSRKQEVIFYSDNCPSQNKNKYMFAMYLYCVDTMDIRKITHKFLIPGHTENEADNMHSCIEREKQRLLNNARNNIYVPSEVSMLIKTSRKTGNAYLVKEMQTEDFLNWKVLAQEIGKNYSINNDEEKCVWSDVKVVEVRKASRNILYYKTSYKDNQFKEVDLRRRARRSNRSDYTLIPAYSEVAAITEKKKQDLLSLCKAKAIPVQHHHFYESLKSSNLTTTPGDDIDN